MARTFNFFSRTRFHVGDRSLSVASCTRLTDSGCPHLASLARLRQLDLRYCTAIGDLTMHVVVEHLPLLNKIQLTMCDRVSILTLALFSLIVNKTC